MDHDGTDEHNAGQYPECRIIRVSRHLVQFSNRDWSKRQADRGDCREDADHFTEMEGAEDMFCQYRGFDQDTAVRKSSLQLKNHERDKSLDPERESDGQGDYDVTNGNTLERGQIE